MPPPRPGLGEASALLRVRQRHHPPHDRRLPGARRTGHQPDPRRPGAHPSHDLIHLGLPAGEPRAVIRARPAARGQQQMLDDLLRGARVPQRIRQHVPGAAPAQEIRALILPHPVLQQRLTQILTADPLVMPRPPPPHIRRTRTIREQPQQILPERPVPGADIRRRAGHQNPEPHPPLAGQLLQQRRRDRARLTHPHAGLAGIHDEQQLVGPRLGTSGDHIRSVDLTAGVASLQPQLCPRRHPMPAPHQHQRTAIRQTAGHRLQVLPGRRLIRVKQGLAGELRAKRLGHRLDLRDRVLEPIVTLVHVDTDADKPPRPFHSAQPALHRETQSPAAHSASRSRARAPSSFVPLAARSASGQEPERSVSDAKSAPKYPKGRAGRSVTLGRTSRSSNSVPGRGSASAEMFAGGEVRLAASVAVGAAASAP